MVDDLSDPGRALRQMKKDIKRTPPRSPSGDSAHLGSGPDSTQVGPNTNAAGNGSSAYGKGAWATADNSTALGHNSLATASQATAIGSNAVSEYDSSTAVGKNASTTAAWQVMLGTSSHTVVVPGAFSNPSARRLKDNITPAPEVDGLFPVAQEYEYKARPGVRRIGYIADDLVGTGAERFVQFDDDGQVEGIAYLDLHTAQIAALVARVERLEGLLAERDGS